MSASTDPLFNLQPWVVWSVTAVLLKINQMPTSFVFFPSPQITQITQSLEITQKWTAPPTSARSWRWCKKTEPWRCFDAVVAWTVQRRTVVPNPTMKGRWFALRAVTRISATPSRDHVRNRLGLQYEPTLLACVHLWSLSGPFSHGHESAEDSLIVCKADYFDTINLAPIALLVSR